MKKNKHRSYNFQKYYPGHEIRNKLIIDNLPASSQWILDVGANNGYVTKTLAKQGHYVLGIESDKRSLRKFFRYRDLSEQSTIMWMTLDSESVKIIPSFDTVLCLSVFHRMWALEGSIDAKNILKTLIQKSKTLFFEGSIRHKRYTSAKNAIEIPNFIDLDLDDAIKWHKKLFDSFDLNLRTKFLGASPHTEKENYRPLFLIEKI